LAQPERINQMLKFLKQNKAKEQEIVRILEDLAREHFTNPFEELARMKKIAADTAKKLKKEAKK